MNSLKFKKFWAYYDRIFRNTFTSIINTCYIQNSFDPCKLGLSPLSENKKKTHFLLKKFLCFSQNVAQKAKRILTLLKTNILVLIQDLGRAFSLGVFSDPADRKVHGMSLFSLLQYTVQYSVQGQWLADISKRTDSTPLRIPNICPPNLSPPPALSGS